MEIINLDSGVGRAAIRAASVLRAGGVMLYPTDTLYGLGADALTDDSVDRIYEIKGRESLQPVSCVVASLAMAARYAEANELAKKLAERFLPGALTIVMKKKKGVTTGIARAIDTIGFRIPDNEFCLELARTFDRPFTATSANRTGVMPAMSATEVLAQLGEGAQGIDLIVDIGWLPENQASTVVSVAGNEIIILREGAIPGADILACVR